MITVKEKTMTIHKDLVANPDIGKDCNGELIYLHDSFYSDVNWSIHYCPLCKKTTASITARHNWNHTHHDPLESSIKKGEELFRESLIPSTEDRKHDLNYE